MASRRNIRDVRLELSGIDFRLLSIAIQGVRYSLRPDIKAEQEELDSRRAALIKEYPKAEKRMDDFMKIKEKR